LRIVYFAICYPTKFFGQQNVFAWQTRVGKGGNRVARVIAGSYANDAFTHIANFEKALAKVNL